MDRVIEVFHNQILSQSQSVNDLHYNMVQSNAGWGGEKDTYFVEKMGESYVKNNHG